MWCRLLGLVFVVYKDLRVRIGLSFGEWIDLMGLKDAVKWENRLNKDVNNVRFWIKFEIMKFYKR